MAYPNDIDTFDERATDDLIPAEDYNGQNDSIIAIETELGALPKGAKADVKTRLDDVDTAIGGKLDNDGDTITGDFRLDSGGGNSPKVYLDNTGTNNKCYLFAEAGNVRIRTNSWITFQDTNEVDSVQIQAAGLLVARKGLRVNGAMLESTEDIKITAAHDYYNTSPGRGLVLKTPDGTKSYKITVDNAGAIVSTLV